MKAVINRRCAFKDFDSAAPALRSAGLRHHGRYGNLIDFERRLLRISMGTQFEKGERAAETNGWDLTIGQWSSKLNRELGDSRSDAGYALAGLRSALASIGARDATIPESAAEHMARSLSYRLPNETWHYLHSLDDGAHATMVMGMAMSLHAGRIREGAAYRPFDGRGHLLLPAELAGEARFEKEACALVRMLACLGLDRGVEKPSDYGVLFAYEDDDGAASSLECMALIEGYRKARSAFVREFGLSTESDVVDFVKAYGRSCRLLGNDAARALQDDERARETARQVILRGPGRVISEW